MADGKRQPANGRMSTPKPAVQGPGDLEELHKAVGCRVKIVTSAPTSSTLEGTIYTTCRITKLVAINTASAPPNPSSNAASHPGDYHLIPTSRIQSFDVLSLPGSATRAEGVAPGFEALIPGISRIDLKALKAREDAALAKIKEKDASKGKGVEKETQMFFDALSRTLPARWHGTSIIVNDNVMIVKPYGPDNCSAPKDKQPALSRVQKVVEYEWKKIAEGASKVAVATPLSGIRKGG